MRTVPLGDRLRVRTPCEATIRWDDMPGSERIRYCASCELDVHDTSTFTRDEVEALLRSRREGARLCVRLHVRQSDGAVLLADGAVLPAKALTKKRRLASAVVTMAAAAVGSSAIAGCGSPLHPAAPTVEVEIPAQPTAPQTAPAGGAPATQIAVAPAPPPTIDEPAVSAEPLQREAPAQPMTLTPVPSPPTATKTTRKAIPPKTTTRPSPAKKPRPGVVIIDGDMW